MWGNRGQQCSLLSQCTIGLGSASAAVLSGGAVAVILASPAEFCSACIWQGLRRMYLFALPSGRSPQSGLPQQCALRVTGFTAPTQLEAFIQWRRGAVWSAFCAFSAVEAVLVQDHPTKGRFSLLFCPPAQSLFRVCWGGLCRRACGLPLSL